LRRPEKKRKEKHAQYVSRSKITGRQPIEFCICRMKDRIASNCLELIFVSVISALAFVIAELANAPFGWEDELGFHFRAP
jgi:hypothetical protein